MRAPQTSASPQPARPQPPNFGRGRRSEPEETSLFSRFYAAGLIVLSGIALSYLTLLLVQPEWAAGIARIAPADAPAKPQRSATQLALDLDSLRRNVADVQRDLAQLKTRVAAREDDAGGDHPRPASLDPVLQRPADGMMPSPASRLPSAAVIVPVPAGVPVVQAPPQVVAAARPAPVMDRGAPPALEPGAPPGTERMASVPVTTVPVTTIPVTTTPPTPEDVRTARAKGPVVTLKPSEASAPPATNPSAEIAHATRTRDPAGPAKTGDPIETGSIAAATPPNIAFGPARVTSAAAPSAGAEEKPHPAGPAGLMLESAPSLDALRLKWAFLNERHSNLIGELEARYQTSTRPAGTSYRLVAGPVATAEEARRICAVLRAQKVTCSVASAFAGKSL